VNTMLGMSFVHWVVDKWLFFSKFTSTLTVTESF
jgi:hypothetical protein